MNDSKQNIKLIENIKLSNTIYILNSKGLIQVLKDSENIRKLKIEDIESKIQQGAQTNIPINGVEDAKSEIFDDYNHYKHHADYLLIHSIFIALYSHFENHLKSLCIYLESFNNQRIVKNSNRGNSYIEKAVQSIEGYIDVKFDYEISTIFNLILDFKEIRNSIVHRGSILNKKGELPLESVKGYNLLVKHGIWHSSPNLYLRIKQHSFLEEFVSCTVQFSNEIVKKIETKVNKN